MPLLLLAGIAFSLGTLGAFFASVSVGLFGYVERLRGPWQESAGGIELISLALLTPLLWIVLRSRQARRSVRLQSGPSRLMERRRPAG